MAATQALTGGQTEVHLFERRKGLGRKLLIAGSSGLNVSHDAPIDEFLAIYAHRDPASLPFLEPHLRDYPAEAWIEFLRSLGHEVFVGTSRRWFVREMKASRLLSSWSTALSHAGCRIHTGLECVNFEVAPDRRVLLSFETNDLQSATETPGPRTIQHEDFDAVVFALGGGSWEDQGPRWPQLFEKKGLKVLPFVASNCGFELDLPPELLREAEGLPIKNCALETGLGKRQGEIVITRYGLEGTPVYFVGAAGPGWLDLKPNLSEEALFQHLSAPLKENLSPLRRLKKRGGLSPGALALVFHLVPPEKRHEIHGNLRALARLVKRLPISFQARRPLSESISSSGGLDWSEVTDQLMLRKFPGVYSAGEMLNWDAPTGGFLIQACVALGASAGRAARSHALSPQCPSS
jgi:uncharacterized flavoprotein (TIGR03862 family)